MGRAAVPTDCCPSCAIVRSLKLLFFFSALDPNQIMLDLDTGRLPLVLMWVLPEVKLQRGDVVAEIHVSAAARLETWVRSPALTRERALCYLTVWFIFSWGTRCRVVARVSHHACPIRGASLVLCSRQRVEKSRGTRLTQCNRRKSDFDGFRASHS